MLIYIEGNIGTGKSTFIDKLQSYLSRFNELDCESNVILEPVDDWMNTKDSDGIDIYTNFMEIKLNGHLHFR